MSANTNDMLMTVFPRLKTVSPLFNGFASNTLTTTAKFDKCCRLSNSNRVWYRSIDQKKKNLGEIKTIKYRSIDTYLKILSIYR